MYHIAGKFGKLGELSMTYQTKPSKLVLAINNLLADILVCQIFFHQMLEKSQFTKLFCHQTFPLYSSTQIKSHDQRSVTEVLSQQT